jgi:steroid delta-isomerase-like uncharacterized protein
MGKAREIVDQWFTLFEAGDIAHLRMVTQPDAAITMPGGMQFSGPDELRPVLEAFHEAFPDLRHEIVDVIESGNKIAVELRIGGTHTGILHTPQGDIPPTGRGVSWESVDFVTLRDGKVATWHTYFDQMAFLAQLGLLPELAAP